MTDLLLIASSIVLKNREYRVRGQPCGIWGSEPVPTLMLRPVVRIKCDCAKALTALTVGASIVLLYQHFCVSVADREHEIETRQRVRGAASRNQRDIATEVLPNGGGMTGEASSQR